MCKSCVIYFLNSALNKLIWWTFLYINSHKTANLFKMTESILYKCILFQERQILCKSCVFIIISARLSTFNLTDFSLPCLYNYIQYVSAHPYCSMFSKWLSIQVNAQCLSRNNVMNSNYSSASSCFGRLSNYIDLVWFNNNSKIYFVINPVSLLSLW